MTEKSPKKYNHESTDPFTEVANFSAKPEDIKGDKNQGEVAAEIVNDFGNDGSISTFDVDPK